MEVQSMAKAKKYMCPRCKGYYPKKELEMHEILCGLHPAKARQIANYIEKIKKIRKPPLLKPKPEFEQDEVVIVQMVWRGYKQLIFNIDSDFDVNNISFELTNLKNIGLDHEYIENVLYKGKTCEEEDRDYGDTKAEELWFLD